MHVLLHYRTVRTAVFRFLFHHVAPSSRVSNALVTPLLLPVPITNYTIVRAIQCIIDLCKRRHQMRLRKQWRRPICPSIPLVRGIRRRAHCRRRLQQHRVHLLIRELRGRRIQSTSVGHVVVTKNVLNKLNTKTQFQSTPSKKQTPMWNEQPHLSFKLHTTVSQTRTTKLLSF